VFLSAAFLGFTAGGGISAPATFGGCDAGLSAGTGRAGLNAGDLSDEQRRNASTIVATARDMGAPARAWLVALATAMQESNLRNLNFGDRDSLGLFQQRPSQGWAAPRRSPTPSTPRRSSSPTCLRSPAGRRCP